ncbi:MAG TPA: MFS transporter, partial [Pirellulaceae bacterium]
FLPTAAGSLLTVFGCGSVMSAFLGGYLATRFGPLRVMRYSLSLTGLALFAFLGARSYWAVAACVAVWSLVADVLRPAIASATTMVTPEVDHPRALTLNRLAENLGTTFGPAIGGLLVEHNYRWLFVADGATCLLAAIVLWRLPALVPPEGPASPLVTRGLRSPWRDRLFLAFLGLMMVEAMVLFQLLGTYPLYLHHVMRFRPGVIGIFFAINTVLIVLFEMQLMTALSRVPRLLVLSGGSLVFCIGFGILGLGQTHGLAYVSLLLWTLGEMLLFSPASAFVSGRSPANRGRYLGAQMGMYSFAFLLTPLISMPVYEAKPQAIWWICLALAPCLALGFWCLHRIVAREGTSNRESACSTTPTACSQT